MRIVLRTSPLRNALYAEAGYRLAASFVEMTASSEAVITDRLADAAAALDAGKHVLFDHPDELNEEDCRVLGESAATSGALIMPGHERRFVPSVAEVASNLQKGNLGEPGLLRIHRWHSEGGDWALLFADLDLACWIFGKAPAAVHVARRSDYSQVHLGFEGGGMALMDHFTPERAVDYDSLTLIGSTGAAYADDHHNMNLLFKDGAPSALCAGPGKTRFVGMLGEFFSAIAESRHPSVSLADTLAARNLVRLVSNSEGRIL